MMSSRGLIGLMPFTNRKLISLTPVLSLHSVLSLRFILKLRQEDRKLTIQPKEFKDRVKDKVRDLLFQENREFLNPEFLILPQVRGNLRVR